MFIAYDPANNYKRFDTEIDAVSAAMDIVAAYRSDAYREGEWDDSVNGVGVYAIPSNVTLDDCYDYGLEGVGGQMTWRTAESGNNEAGYDYRLERVSAGGAGE